MSEARPIITLETDASRHWSQSVTIKQDGIDVGARFSTVHKAEHYLRFGQHLLRGVEAYFADKAAREAR